MPRAKGIPSYCHHKSTGQARVIIDGRHHYLGPYGSPESREKYARLISSRRAAHAVAAAGEIEGTFCFSDRTVPEN